MNKYYFFDKNYYPSGRTLALKIARHHVNREFNDTDDHQQNAVMNEYMLAFDRTYKLLVKLGAETDQEKLRKLSLKMFRQKSPRLVAVLVAVYFKNADESRGIPDSLTRSRAYKLAKACSCLRKTHEPYERVVINRVGKPARITWKFGIVRYSQQLLASWLMLAQRKLPGYDYFLPSDNPWKRSRGGHHAAAEAIGRGLEEGFRFWATFDIKHAYSSISRDIVRSLFTMDRNILRYVVHPVLQDDCPSHKDTLSNQKASQSQLPQGSAHAWIILSALIDEVLLGNPMGAHQLRLVVYADNVAVGAHYLQSAISALRSVEAKLSARSVENGPAAGKLILHQKIISDGFQRRDYSGPGLLDGIDCYNSVDFCGYRIRFDTPDGETKFAPSGEAWSRFWKGVQRDFLNYEFELEDFEAFHSIVLFRYARWSKSFSLWRHQKESEELVGTLAFEKHNELVSARRHHWDGSSVI